MSSLFALPRAGCWLYNRGCDLLQGGKKGRKRKAHACFHAGMRVGRSTGTGVSSEPWHHLQHWQGTALLERAGESRAALHAHLFGTGRGVGLGAHSMAMDQGLPGAKGIKAGSLEMLLPAKATKTPSSTRV